MWPMETPKGGGGESSATESLRAWLARHESWKLVGNRLEKVFRFGSFRDSIVFVNRLATLADDHDHHPDIDVRYTNVRVSLWTHTAGGVTGRDTQLAEAIDFSTAHR